VAKRLFFSAAACGFLGLAFAFGFGVLACRFFSATLRFQGSHSTSLFFSASASLFFGLTPGLVFDFAASFGFRAHLRFNLSAQACFVFRPTQGARLCVTASFVFRPTLGGVLGQHSRVFSRPATGVFARLHPGDLDLDGVESHLGMPAQFIFLRALSGLAFQKATLFFGVDPRLLLFRMSSLFQFRAVRFFGSSQPSVNVSAARIFHGPHALQFFFGARELLLRDPAATVFLGLFASFGGDSLFLVFRTLT